MDWPTFAAARQYLLEERVGSKVREAKEYERAQARAASRRTRR